MRALITIAMAASLAAQTRRVPANGYDEWRVFGGGAENIHYSRLKQINRSNANQLKVAWTYDTGDVFSGSEMQCNPLVIDGVMYASTPKLRVIALDAATGKERWAFDPNVPGDPVRKARNRGLSYWQEGEDKRIFFVSRHWLWALDAKTGKPVASFGKEGRVDLRENLGRAPETITIAVSTPGVVYKDLLILGSLVSESLPAAPGDIRAFDVRTGKMRWTFHTIPHPGELGYETWPKDGWTYLGAANNWAGMALDEKRGLLFAPTGSAAFDFYGANRVGDNLFANCLLALKADTGQRVWHFQMVKHDVWDRDLPSAPALVTVRHKGKLVDAVAQITKSGHVYVFNRATGDPLFPIEYKEVPASEVDGEVLAKTQPLPLKPPPFSRQVLTEEMLTKRTPEAHQAAVEKYRKVRSAGQWVPPSFEGTVIFPGFDGGGEWGGAAFDPETGLFYVNANEMAWILRIVPQAVKAGKVTGKDLYMRNCASCHRADLAGTPPEFPALGDVGSRRTEEQITTVIRLGAGRMPGFGRIGEEAVRAITRYVMTKEEVEVESKEGPMSPMDLKYRMDGYNKFLDPEGYPAVEPPWGTLNAIDLDKGVIKWKIPFGEFPELAAKGMKNTGTENYGGGIVTAGGLFFIGATNHDKKFHVFDKLTGKLLWETVLPAAGNATPAMYDVKGKQYVVIAAGGGKSGAPSGGMYVAFALPD